MDLQLLQPNRRWRDNNFVSLHTVICLDTCMPSMLASHPFKELNSNVSVSLCTVVGSIVKWTHSNMTLNQAIQAFLCADNMMESYEHAELPTHRTGMV